MEHANTVRILGHRGGAGGAYPENSIPAFRRGLEAGAQGVEFDVHLSRDNRVIVIHDPRIDRVSVGSGQVADLGAAELRRFALVDGAGTPHVDVRIPVLEELIEALGPVQLNIDLKTAEIGLARAVADIVRRYDAVERTVVASFIPEAIRFFRSIAPEIATATHPGEVRSLVRARWCRDRIEVRAKRAQIPARHRLLPLATKGFIKYLHTQDLAVDVWTVNNWRLALQLAYNGVDGLVTDDVASIRSALISGGIL
ncbi:MAG: glycerophosphodiester phosphodiesterase family protein [Alkalispirochaeta sp.]